MLYLILGLAFLTVVLTMLGIYNLVFSTRANVRNRLEIYTSEELVEEEKLTLRDSVLRHINRVGGVLSRKDSLEKKQAKLNQAYIHMKVEEFLGLSILTALVLGLFLFLLTRNLLILLLGLIIGYMIPDLYVNSTKKKRMAKLNKQLPEALNIISNGLRAGFSFNQAMDVAAREMDSPIKVEFQKVLRDNSIGKTMDRALTDFAGRVDDEDVDMFITALLIQRQVGGNLADVLDTISETVRERVRIRGEVQTMTAQGRMSALIISILPFGIAGFIFVSNPEYIMELFTNPIGIAMVALAVLMQVIGILIIRKMVDIEY